MFWGLRVSWKIRRRRDGWVGFVIGVVVVVLMFRLDLWLWLWERVESSDVSMSRWWRRGWKRRRGWVLLEMDVSMIVDSNSIQPWEGCVEYLL